MNRGKGLTLAFALAVMTACASGGAGGGVVVDDNGGGGVQPTDNASTRSAGVHLAQAATTEGEAATEHYRLALNDALASLQAEPNNPKGYLLAGQAAIGVGNWVQADSMLDRAVELYPGYQSAVAAEREVGWVSAYNQGIEVLNTGDDAAALEYFRGADLLYQERPEAKMILGALNTRAGNTEEAIEAYRGALEILEGPPPEELPEDQLAGWAEDARSATMSLSQLLAQGGDFQAAADVLGDYLAANQGTLTPENEMQILAARANYLSRAGQTAEAEAIYNDLLTREGLTSNEYFQIGIGMFNAGDYVRAADAFRSAAELNPYSRDALLNLVQSLYSEALELDEQPQSAERDARLREIYEAVVEASEQVQGFDPLNRNLMSFMLRAYRGLADLSTGAQVERYNRTTQDLYRQYQEQRYEVDELSLSLEQGNQARVTGVFTNLSGQAGEQVQLRFTVVNRQGQAIDSEMIPVTVPPADQSVQFTATVDLTGGEFAGWRYELVD